MIKKYDLEPTFENVANTFLNDSLKRNRFLYKFYDLLNCIDSPFSICLDGPWGCGKTFFVKQTQLLLLSINPCIDIQEGKDAINQNERNTLIEIKAEVEKKYQNIPTIHYPIYYDAWDNDNAEDPILSLVYAITKALHSEGVFDEKSEKWNGIKNTIKAIVNATEVQSSLPIESAKVSIKVKGENFLKALEQNKKSDLLVDFKKQDELRLLVDTFFNDILPERGDRLVIFIDELDRCKPTYAIKLLERIKHYFNQEKVTFVFSTNIQELNKTICSYYGQGFSADRYLDKFFNLRLQLPKVDVEQYFNYLRVFNTFGKLESILEEVVLHTNLELREISRFISLYYLARNSYLGLSFAQKTENDAMDFCIDYILPLMIAIKMTDSTLYNSFMLGNETEFFQNFMRGNIGEIFFNFYSFYPKSEVSFDDISGGIYNWLFNVGILDTMRDSIKTTLSFSPRHKVLLEEAISLLSFTTIYD
ncbi:MAG: hypothetical protein J6R67_01155 [Treponema sp.]|nr:hypothetical protein [Treponema sp.]